MTAQEANEQHRKTPTRRAQRERKATKRRRSEKVLITGAAGALAEHVIDRLKVDYQIIGVDFQGRKATHPDTVDYEVDFNKRTFEDVFREHEFVAVIHLGRIQSSQLDRGRRYSSNVVGTQRLLKLARKYGVEQTIVLSTYHVYGADPLNPSLIDEDYPLKAAGLTQDLVDAVELENLANIHLYKYPELNITVLRPCNIAGPGVNNAISRVLAQRAAPCLAGFSPLMQFIHVDDMARAIIAALQGNKPGIYNVGPEDWVAYQEVLIRAGCRRLFLPSVPPAVARRAVRMLGRYSFPAYLIEFFKYPLILDGSRFAKTFDFTPEYALEDVLAYYRRKKRG